MARQASMKLFRQTPNVDFRETTVLWVFLAVAILISLGALANGAHTYFRVMDTSDMYFDKVRFLVNFWKDAEGYSWNPNPMRGWPSHAGSIGPQHLLVLLATLVSEVYAFIIFRIIIDFMTMSGMFLFAKRITSANTSISIVAALVYCSSYYWYDENIVVTAAQLLPLAVVVTAFHEKWPPLPSAFKMLSFFVLLTASYPAYTLPLMPIAHGVVLLIFISAIDWKKTALYVTVFWLSFLIFHGQTILAVLDLLSESNRSLWVPMANSAYPDLYSSVVSYFTNDTFIYPAFLMMFFVNKANARVIALSLATALVLLSLACYQSSIHFVVLAEKFPALNHLNSTLHRCLNFIPLALATGMILALKKTKDHQYKLPYMMIIFAVYALFISVTLKPNINRAFEEALVIGFIYLLIIKMHAGQIQKFNPVIIGLIGMMVLVPAKYKNTSFREKPQMGAVYVDNFDFPKGDPYRAVTLMQNHFSPILFPAQLSIKGVETFDGFSVFYDRDDADFWRKNIDIRTNSLLKKYGYHFNNWNNRIEFRYEE
ncbi:MAG: hypothetical protein J4F41_05100 [Alphaproteobacteria bacterium]|nr:hypothetical protein [Alphaproteobacteria bacterium]